MFRNTQNYLFFFLLIKLPLKMVKLLSERDNKPHGNFQQLLSPQKEKKR